MVLLFGDWGVNSALTKFIAQYRAEGKKNEVISILGYSLIFKVGLSVLLTLVMFFLSDFLASYVLQKPEATSLVQVSCLMFLGNQLYNTCWSIFLGFEEARYNALIQVLFSALKTPLAVLLVLLGWKSFGAMVGLSLSYLVAGIFGIVVVLLISSSLFKRRDSEQTMKFKETMGIVIGFGLPLAILSIISGFGSQFYNFLMARYASAESIGNFGVASTFTVLVNFITFPVVHILLPTFSKLTGEESREGLEIAFRASVKYVSFIVLPATVGVIVLSQPLVGILFGEQYNQAPLFLALTSVGSLLCCLGSLSAGSLLSSQGETKAVLVIGLFTMTIGVPLGLALIPYFGVIGFILTNLFTQTIGTLLNIYWIHKLKFRGWINQSARTFVASFSMGIFVWITINMLRIWAGVNNNMIILIVGFIVGLLSYMLLLPLMKGIELRELEVIKDIFGRFGYLKPIIQIPYIIMEKIVQK